MNQFYSSSVPELSLCDHSLVQHSAERSCFLSSGNTGRKFLSPSTSNAVTGATKPRTERKRKRRRSSPS